ncbi:MAG: hypothetical protein NTX06_10960 [Proteobacteria bacterium]|nr:hypothetical protein [Pseudomonadota bacterium]
MAKWKYKSLEWIHSVREQDYNETKDLAPDELINKTRENAEELARSLGLKIVSAHTVSTNTLTAKSA